MTREEAAKLYASIARARRLVDSGLQGPRHQRGDFWAAMTELGEALAMLAEGQPPCTICAAPMRASTGFSTCGNDHPAPG